MQKWNKQHDRELSARAEKRVLFWDSAKRGTYIKPETILERAQAAALKGANDTRYVLLHSEGIL